MFYSIPRFKLLSVLLTTVIFPSVTQSKSIELNKEQRKEVIEGISKIIIENYVFPKVAQKNANFIQEQFKSGKYREIIDASKFAEQLTIDLQKINHDKHMEVRVKKPQKSQPEQMQSSNPYLEYLNKNKKRITVLKRLKF